MTTAGRRRAWILGVGITVGLGAGGWALAASDAGMKANDAKEELGALLFFDESLSTPPGQSCARPVRRTVHTPVPVSVRRAASSSHRSTARPTTSKPGPRLEVEAATRTRAPTRWRRLGSIVEELWSRGGALGMAASRFRPRAWRRSSG